MVDYLPDQARKGRGAVGRPAGRPSQSPAGLESGLTHAGCAQPIPSRAMLLITRGAKIDAHMADPAIPMWTGPLQFSLHPAPPNNYSRSTQSNNRWPIPSQGQFRLSGTLEPVNTYLRNAKG